MRLQVQWVDNLEFLMESPIREDGNQNHLKLCVVSRNCEGKYKGKKIKKESKRNEKIEINLELINYLYILF